MHCILSKEWEVMETLLPILLDAQPKPTLRDNIEYTAIYLVVFIAVFTAVMIANHVITRNRHDKNKKWGAHIHLPEAIILGYLLQIILN